MTVHQFSDADRAQAWFKRLESSLEARLAKLREKNDGDRDAEGTAHLRGQIAVVKELLNDMSEKSTPIPAPKRNPYQ